METEASIYGLYLLTSSNTKESFALFSGALFSEVVGALDKGKGQYCRHILDLLGDCDFTFRTSRFIGNLKVKR